MKRQFELTVPARAIEILAEGPHHLGVYLKMTEVEIGVEEKFNSFKSNFFQIHWGQLFDLNTSKFLVIAYG